LLCSTLWYGTWLLHSVNTSALWCAVPFVAANLLAIATAIVAVVNNWTRSVPPERLIAPGAEPVVVVIIPTCGEPPLMVTRTARSVLDQDWPHRQLRLIISDDAHSPAIAGITAHLQGEYPAATIVYHEPPARGTSQRRGDAKAGNLNSALDLATRSFPDMAYIETRDADDLVGDPSFLRHCIGQLEHDHRLAYVQTIKEARVSVGDPFNNNEPLFYRGQMLAKHAANAVFPCGSGVVWRRAALMAIDGFPTWNLVEDLQSGVEALRRGWRSAFVPIVGVLSQHAPEDVPNVYKQRGVWALDTMRLLLWGDLRGLNLRQRLHFIEMGLFYVLGFASLAFMLVPVLSFVWHVRPLTTTQLSYAVHFWPVAAALEAFMAAMNGSRPYTTLWRARQMWIGLSTVYMKACLIALLAGPARKPTYRVTRKEHRFGWYWRETLPQATIILVLLATGIYGVLTSPVPTQFDLESAFWASFFILMLGGFVRKGWFGCDVFSRDMATVREKLHAPSASAVPRGNGVGRGAGPTVVSLDEVKRAG
jgi:cellulose synthase (UDP-forming)